MHPAELRPTGEARRRADHPARMHAVGCYVHAYKSDRVHWPARECEREWPVLVSCVLSPLNRTRTGRPYRARRPGASARARKESEG
jgi:hypothetical protein